MDDSQSRGTVHARESPHLSALVPEASHQVVYQDNHGIA